MMIAGVLEFRDKGVGAELLGNDCGQVWDGVGGVSGSCNRFFVPLFIVCENHGNDCRGGGLAIIFQSCGRHDLRCPP